MDTTLPQYITDFIGKGSRCKYPPGLYLVGTPIGNLEDVTLRALYTLHLVDLVVCEDTRISGQLLGSYGLKKPLMSFHGHSGEKTLNQILEHLNAGKRVAYISDAGMPLVSDPGYELVQACLEHKIYVTTVPGPTAFVSALVLAGLPTHHFSFWGFFPEKLKAQEQMLDQALKFPGTSIFYESPHRLLKTLSFLKENAPHVPMALGRELTKLHETTYRGLPGDLLEVFQETPPRGEFVLLLAPPVTHGTDLAENLDDLLREALANHSLKDAVQVVAKAYHLPKNQVYERALVLKKGPPHG